MLQLPQRLLFQRIKNVFVLTSFTVHIPLTIASQSSSALNFSSCAFVLASCSLDYLHTYEIYRRF